MTESLGGPAGERPSLSGPSALGSHLGDVQHTFLCTLETQRGITECGVTSLGGANAVKVFRAEKGRIRS